MTIYEPHQISPERKEEILQNLGVLTVRFEIGSLKYYETGSFGM